MDLKIPDENVVLDKVGQRKLGLDNPKVSRRRPTTLEKGPDGKRIVKRSSKKRHLDSEDEEQNGMILYCKIFFFCQSSS